MLTLSEQMVTENMSPGYCVIVEFVLFASVHIQAMKAYEKKRTLCAKRHTRYQSTRKLTRCTDDSARILVLEQEHANDKKLQAGLDTRDFVSIEGRNIETGEGHVK